METITTQDDCDLLIVKIIETAFIPSQSWLAPLQQTHSCLYCCCSSCSAHCSHGLSLSGWTATQRLLVIALVSFLHWNRGICSICTVYTQKLVTIANNLTNVLINGTLPSILVFLHIKLCNLPQVNVRKTTSLCSYCCLDTNVDTVDIRGL